MKAEIKRTAHSYKVKGSLYKKAMGRAKKEKGKLSNLIELVVIAYASGLDIKAHKKLENGESALDIFSKVVGGAENYIELHNQK